MKAARPTDGGNPYGAYVVIRPFSPVHLPEQRAATEITSAIRTLQRHGMLVQAPDARTRDNG